MSESINKVIGELDKATIEVKSLFGNLSLAQLNWKPFPEKWSIAQCLDHLIVTNSTYYPQFDEIIAGKHKNSFYQNIRFLSGFFGKQLIKDTGLTVTKKMKSPGAFAPSLSQLPGTIVSDFEKHQQELSRRIQRIDKVDLDKTILYSPALKILTYSLRDNLTILVGHEQRHLAQARNVLALLKQQEK